MHLDVREHRDVLVKVDDLFGVELMLLHAGDVLVADTPQGCARILATNLIDVKRGGPVPGTEYAQVDHIFDTRSELDLEVNHVLEVPRVMAPVLLENVAAGISSVEDRVCLT